MATTARTTALTAIQAMVCESDPPALPVPLSVFVADATGAEMRNTAIVREAAAISRARVIIRPAA
jgi:hypothetical protein